MQIKFTHRSLLARNFFIASILCGFLSAQAQVSQTYSPAAWVNDPFNNNANWTVTSANTTHPTYQNTGNAANANLIGNSPIGGTVTLANAGDTAILTGQIMLAGNVTANDKQFRFGLLYKGANTTDTGWAGDFVGDTSSVGGGLYLRTIPNSGFYTSGTGANTPTVNAATAGVVFSGVFGAGTFDYYLSVTKLSSTSTLVIWDLSGPTSNPYHFSGRYTNTTATAQGGFNFDQVGFLSGSSLWSAASTNNMITFTNILVSFGSFSDGTWTNDASSTWSATANWLGGLRANGAGFIGDFSQVNLTADRTVTVDSSRTVGSLLFGATSGSTKNWNLVPSGGSTLMLDTAVFTRPAIAVNQNTTTLGLPLISTLGLTKTGSGTLSLTATNTITGPLNLNGGTLSFLSLSNLSVDLTTLTGINFGGGTLQWGTGNTADISATGIPINFNSGAGFDTLANNVTLANGFGNFGTGSFTKLGSGRLTLNSYAGYSGNTTISNGVLALGSAGSLPSTTKITVMSGATFDVSALTGGFTLNAGETLAGTGTVLGNVSDASTAIIAPGTGAGTLTVNGNLVLNGGGALNYELSNVTTSGSGVNDLTVVTGDLNIAGPTTLNLTLLNGSPASSGIYTLFTYNTFSGSAANITAPAGFTITNNTSAKTIGLIVNHTPAALTWRGDGAANVWDVGITANWLQAGTNQLFFTGDSVTFDNTGFNSPAINLASAVAPGSVLVNASQDYDLTGGAIVSGSLTKTNTGTLILETDNTFTSPTLISGGVLQLGNAGITGSLSSGTITNNSRLVFNRADDTTNASAILGTGSVTNIGPAGALTLSGNIAGSTLNMFGFGSLILSGSNSYSGQTIVSSGSLHPRNSSALGTIGAGTVVSNGAQLYIDANIDISGESLSLQGVGPVGDGALRKGGTGASLFGGVITIGADTRLQVDGGATLTLTNTTDINAPGINVTLGADNAGQGTIAAALNLGTGMLTKEGAGNWTIAPTNNFTGKTFINAGVLAIASTAALGPVSIFTPDYVTLNGGSLGVTTNVTFADGLRGFTVSGTASGFSVDAGLTLVISNDITGSGILTKRGAGTLVLSGSNSFNGTLNIDSALNVGSDGSVRIANSNAITGVLSPISIRNNNGGASTLELDGSNGGITVAQNIAMNGRSTTTPAIDHLAGSNTISGNIRTTGGGTQYRIQSDSGLLTLAGAVSNAISQAVAVTFQGSGNTLVAGSIQDGLNPLSINKEGSGQLTLNGTNSYTGSTLVSAGTLGGTGSLNGPVTVSAGGTLSPGASSIGTLTINGSLTLAGNTFIEVNKTIGTRDQVVGLTSVTYGGTLTVSNLIGTLAANDSFQIFPATTFTGNFSSITPALNGGLSWSFNRTNGVLSVVSGVALNSTNITFSVSGSTLALSWPTDHLGWILQSQTNALSKGVSTNWVDIAGTASVTQTNINIIPANPTVFFRLRSP